MIDELKTSNEELLKKLNNAEKELKQKIVERKSLHERLFELKETIEEKETRFSHLNTEFRDKILEMENFFSEERKTFQLKLKTYESEEVKQKYNN